MYSDRYASPIGVLLLLSDGDSLTGLYTEAQPDFPDAIPRDLPVFHAVRDWLDAYFRGEIREISFPLRPQGTEFQQQVWKLLLQIPFGKTATYGQLARAIRPNMSAQAVGGAVGKNPICILIPCHRVLGSGGKLTGYAGGLERKQWLLHHEEERQ